MGLYVNTNIVSLTAQHHLENHTRRLNQALTRLSTGLRINSGADDAVGLAISEGLRSQIRGADIARTNIANATSVMEVAEGFLSQLTDISQSLRDVALQAADDTLSQTSRDALAQDLEGLLAEYNRVVENADFNGVRLLDGSFVGRGVQVGSNENESFDVSIGDARAATIGEIAIYTAETRSASAVVASTTALSFTDPAGLAIAGVTIATSAFSSDGVSNTEADESAIAYVNAINGYTALTGVTAQVLSNVKTFDYGAAANGLYTNHNLVINGVTVKSDPNAYASDDAGVANLVTLINAQSSLTGVTAAQDSTNNILTLTAADGRNIDIVVTGGTGGATDVYGMTGAGANNAVLYRSTFKLTANDAFTITGGTVEFTGSDPQTVTVDTATSLNNISADTAALAGTAISILDKVIAQLQASRASVGGALNRLEIADAEVAARLENYSAAESRIRDVDVAAETAEYTLASVLQQLSATVLAQANSSPQIALILLEGL